MDVASREKLIEQIAVKDNIWSQLALDIQLDVFQCLRAYDLYKNGRFVSVHWYDVIERHKGMLPKFRKLPDWLALNKLVGDNSDEVRLQRNELVRRNVEYKERLRRKVERIRNKYLTTYLVLCIISFITSLTPQFGDMFIERLTTTLLLLAIALRMGDTYEKFIKYRVSCSRHYFEDETLEMKQWKLNILGDYYYSFEKFVFLKYVWPAYLAGRSLIFGSIAILTDFNALPGMFSVKLFS
ncbi:hypothetical protein Ddc_17248 [Ditylenchus destructor]|nr:hypothetical protein Ddc_17248 [Ditylenchus destructor]